MEFCPYCKIEDYNSLCQCNKTGDICPLTYRCNIEHRHKPLKSMETCSKRKTKEIPEDAYKVRFEKHGKLFIEVKDTVIELENPYKDIPSYVFLSFRNQKYTIIDRD